MAAFEILLKVEKEKSFSSVLLPLYEENLGEKDRALCHEITLGVLRRQIYLDRIIENLSNKIIENLDAAVLISLRLGLYQLIFLDKIPAYSAINDGVNLVKRAGKTSASGFVNAILRRASREKNFEFEFSDETEKIAVETSHPRWLIEKWSVYFGFEEAEKLARANNEAADLTFRFTLKTGAETPENLNRRAAETPNFIEKSDLLENCFRVRRMDSDLQDLAEKGEIYFQDEASQMVAVAVDLKADDSFFDVCAAPGSKTTLVGSKFKVQGSKLFVAGDLYFQRVRLLEKNCLNQGVDFAQILQYNAETSLPFADEVFDAVLIDAPCTGTGTIRHNPEIRYFLRKEDFSLLSGKQLAVLQNASKLVKVGGRLIYSTCSLEPEENEAVIENFLAENKDFRKTEPSVPKRFITQENFARTFPPRDGMDGFFIASLRRMS